MLVAMIDGQEVIPVRAIYYITYGNIAPETLVGWLAGEISLLWPLSFRDEEKVTAYRLSNHGNVTPMTQAEWRRFIYSLKSLSERFDNLNKDFDEWLDRAIRIVPPAFITKEDFLRVYSYIVKEKRRCNYFEEPEWNPYVPKSLCEVVVEDFESRLIPSLKIQQNETVLSNGTKSRNVGKTKRGRRPQPFTEAITHLYKKLLDENKYTYLEKRKTSTFIGELRKRCDENKPVYDDFLVERIKYVKKVSGKYVILTQEIIIDDGSTKKILKSRSFDSRDVSKRLYYLRKDKSLNS